MGLIDKLEQSGSFGEYNIKEISEDVIQNLYLNQLEIISNQPFKEYTNTNRYQSLVESIKTSGITNPLIVRLNTNNNKYTILSGRHRYLVAKDLTLEKIPCIVKKNITDDEANLILLDSNLCQREELLPSEKAFSYKQKMDILSRRGHRTDLIDNEENHKSTEILSKELGITSRSVEKYIRLVYLIKPLLELLDNKKITFNVAYNLSFLLEQEQLIVYEIISNNNIVIKSNIATSLKNASKTSNDPLNKDFIYNTIFPNDIIKDKVVKDSTSFKDLYLYYLKDFFNENTSPKEVMDIIQLSLTEYFSKNV